MRVYVRDAQLLVRCNPVDARIYGVASAGPVAPPDTVAVRGMIAVPNRTGWRGDYMLIDYFAVVWLENYLRDRHPEQRTETVRRRLRSMVRCGGHLGDMLLLRDGADRAEAALPWQGECEWLMKECARSASVGPFLVRLERIGAAGRYADTLTN